MLQVHQVVHVVFSIGKILVFIAKDSWGLLKIHASEGGTLKTVIDQIFRLGITTGTSRRQLPLPTSALILFLVLAIFSFSTLVLVISHSILHLV